MNKPVVLTIDIGSSSVRANLFAADARQLVEYETQIPYQFDTTSDGGVEMEAEKLLDCVYSAVDGTLVKARKVGAEITGVGMCSLVSNVVGVDAEGKAITPVYTWADTRSAPQAERLRKTLKNRDLLLWTGCPIHTSYLPARLLWIKETMPDVFGKVSKWLSMGDLVHYRLFGREARQHRSVASWGGLINRHSMSWDEMLLGSVGIEESVLPRIVEANQPQSGLKDEFAARWPLLRDVPWYPCVGDGVTSTLGSGCAGEDEIAVQVGTSGAMRAFVPSWGRHKILIPDGLWSYILDRPAGLLERSLMGGALSEGGNLLDWLYGLLKVEDRATVEWEAAQMEPDSHGLTVLPFVAGERSPGWRGDARASIVGMSLDTKAAHLVRACQEAVAYRFGLIYDLMRKVLPPPKRIVASGGALLGTEGWIGMLADVLGAEVTASGEAQASSRGTAMLVLRALGLIEDFEDVPAKMGRVYAPDMGRHEVYREAMGRQEELYRRLLG